MGVRTLVSVVRFFEKINFGQKYGSLPHHVFFGGWSDLLSSSAAKLEVWMASSCPVCSRAKTAKTAAGS